MNLLQALDAALTHLNDAEVHIGETIDRLSHTVPDLDIAEKSLYRAVDILMELRRRFRDIPDSPLDDITEE